MGVIDNLKNWFIKRFSNRQKLLNQGETESQNQIDQQTTYKEEIFEDKNPEFRCIGKFNGETAYKINNPEDSKVTELRLKDNINPVGVGNSLVYTAYRKKTEMKYDNSFGLPLEEIQFALPEKIDDIVATMNGRVNNGDANSENATKFIENADEYAKILGKIVYTTPAMPSSMIEGIKKDEKGFPVELSYQEAANLYRMAKPLIDKARQDVILGTASRTDNEKYNSIDAR